MDKLIVKELKVYVYGDSTYTDLIEIFVKKEILVKLDFEGELDIKDVKIIGLSDKLYRVYKKEIDDTLEEKTELFFVNPDIMVFPKIFIEQYKFMNNSLPKTKEQWYELLEKCDEAYFIQY